MVEANEVGARVAAHVAELVGRPVGPADPIISSRLLESIAAVQLVEIIESEFGVEVPDEDLVLDNFDSIDSIAVLVRRLGNSR